MRSYTRVYLAEEFHLAANDHHVLRPYLPSQQPTHAARRSCTRTGLRGGGGGSSGGGGGYGGGGGGGGGRYGGGATLDRDAPLRVHTHARDNGYTYDRVTGDRIKDVKERR